MIYTCTLNPSVDYVVHVDEFKVGTLNRATNTAYYHGGKGINVSRVLNRLGISTTALGFTGGFTGEFIKSSLQTEGILTDFTSVSEPTRVNVKLKSSVESEINGQGSMISEEEQKELFEKISSFHSGDYLVLAGSLPPSISPEFYQQIGEACRNNNVRLVADTSGQALSSVMTTKPFLIKPNQHELGELFGVEITSVDDAEKYALKLLDMGIENIIVSLGGDGALFLNNEVKARANVPKGKLVNSVGAGDSLVAGFIASFVQHGNILEAFKYGIAAGSATAFSSDLCDKASLEKLLPEIDITEL